MAERREPAIKGVHAEPAIIFGLAMFVSGRFVQWDIGEGNGLSIIALLVIAYGLWGYFRWPKPDPALRLKRLANTCLAISGFVLFMAFGAATEGSQRGMWYCYSALFFVAVSMFLHARIENRRHQFQLRSVFFVIAGVAIALALSRIVYFTTLTGVLTWVWIVASIVRARLVARHKWTALVEDAFWVLPSAWWTAMIFMWFELTESS